MKRNNRKLRFRFSNYAVITFALSIATSQAAVADSCTTIDKNLATHYKSMAEHSSYYGKYDDNNFDKATKDFYDAVADYTVAPDGIACDLDQAKKVGINVNTSADGKFRTLSWDELNGGTMHHFNGLIQYQGKYSTHILTNAINSQVLELQTIELSQYYKHDRSIYILTDHFIGSTRDHYQSVTLYEIENEKLMYPNLIQTTSRTTNELGFSYDTRSLNKIHIPLMQVDTDKQTITFPVVLDSDEYPSGEVTNRLIKYQFKDGFFRKVTS